jgi:hypothetical protein
MAAQVSSSTPSPVVLRMINPVVRMWVATPLSRRIGHRLAELRFNGRKSGREYRIPVGLHDVGEWRVVFTSEVWRLNFRHGAPLTVKTGGRTFEATGTLVEDPEEVARALQHAIDSGASLSLLGLKMEKGHRITADDVRDMRDMVRVSASA